MVGFYFMFFIYEKYNLFFIHLFLKSNNPLVG